MGCDVITDTSATTINFQRNTKEVGNKLKHGSGTGMEYELVTVKEEGQKESNEGMENQELLFEVLVG